MSSDSLPIGREADSQLDGADAVRYVARQPILDVRSKVYAYELLFGDGPETSPRDGPKTAACTLIDNTVLFGLEKLTSGLPAFVKCTPDMMSGALVEMLPAEMTVLEIAEDAEQSPELAAMCQGLKSSGYRLALDDFTWRPGIAALLESAAYVKVSFSRVQAEDRHELLSRLDGAPVKLIAKKVETQEQFGQACDEGFELVQGFYFCRPVMLENRKVPANRIAQIEILRMLQEESLHLRKLTELVKRDVALTYRLLRLINSPACAVRQEVHSVQTAILAVGEETFRRMATVAIASEMNAGRPSELLRMAFMRGRFCEQAARYCALNASEQYLLGLLSLLPAMMRIPMSELAPQMPLREPIRQALVGGDGAERRLLRWLERYEQADWAACDWIASELNLPPRTLIGCSQEALAWAEAAVYFASA
jgi:EAL and modified HD-GYP domain-containing signal transduction protein